jgi:hypothetical protein
MRVHELAGRQPTVHITVKKTRHHVDGHDVVPVRRVTLDRALLVLAARPEHAAAVCNFQAKPRAVSASLDGGFSLAAIRSRQKELHSLISTSTAPAFEHISSTCFPSLKSAARH